MEITKTVGNSWVSFETYVSGIRTYKAFCAKDRQVQVGMGVFLFGSPRGEKIHFSGEVTFKTVGFGAVQFHVTDGRGPALVSLYLVGDTLIPIIPPPWEHLPSSGDGHS